MSRVVCFPQFDSAEAKSRRTWQDFYWFTGGGNRDRSGKAFN